jgi:glycosyltransferase involved in cell wall biosynthesis
MLIGYAGTIGVANALDVLIEAANTLKKEKVSFIIVGDGPNLSSIKVKIHDLKLTNTHLVGRIDKLAVHSFLQQMDFLYIGLQDKPVFLFGISANKIFDYMMAGKPIIQSINTTHDIVKRAKCGFTAEPGNSTALAKLIKKALSASKQTQLTMGKNGHAYVLKKHTYDFIAQQFIDSIKPQ